MENLAPTAPAAPPQDRSLLWAVLFCLASLAIIPLNFFVWTAGRSDTLSAPFLVLALAQLGTGVAAAVFGIRRALHNGSAAVRAVAVLVGIFGALLGLGGPVGVALALVAPALAFGGAWGRPLRIRGRILHPELCIGSDWTRGDRPVREGLDDATCRALEALWLHDAQKEHASVPAFARISWLLAAVGSPAELLEGAHIAALQEIDHARRCFALAAGYGGRSHAVEPMPELLAGGLSLGKHALEHLAVESLKDGCLLEDFNADVAAACARACAEPAARAVLARIAREERAHAEFSWQLLAWALERGGARVQQAVTRALGELEHIARPTAVSAAVAPLVAAADAARLRAHGRLPDNEWAEIYRGRLAATQQRVRGMLAPERARRAA